MEYVILAQSAVKYALQKPGASHVVLAMLHSYHQYNLKYTHVLNVYIRVLLVLETLTHVLLALMDFTLTDGSVCPFSTMASKYTSNPI